jgi:hypothetical protein
MLMTQSPLRSPRYTIYDPLCVLLLIASVRHELPTPAAKPVAKPVRKPKTKAATKRRTPVIKTANDNALPFRPAA